MTLMPLVSVVSKVIIRQNTARQIVHLLSLVVTAPLLYNYN